jgi:hypothetical protein
MQSPMNFSLSPTWAGLDQDTNDKLKLVGLAHESASVTRMASMALINDSSVMNTTLTT